MVAPWGGSIACVSTAKEYVVAIAGWSMVLSANNRQTDKSMEPVKNVLMNMVADILRYPYQIEKSMGF